MTEPITTKRRISGDEILEACRQLATSRQPITHAAVAEAALITRNVAEDHVKRLYRLGYLARTKTMGVYVLKSMDELEPDCRSISQTMLPNGFVKIEMGEEVFTLSPLEYRQLAMMLAGALIRFGPVAA